MSLKKILKNLLNVNYIKIISCNFDYISHALHIHLDMTKGKKHRCSICGRKSPHYGTTTKRKKWRTLDFGSCAVYITCDVHRVDCKVHGVHTEQVQ